MLTNDEILDNSVYYNAKSLIYDFNKLKEIAESDIRDILYYKKSKTITPLWVDFCSCGNAVYIDRVFLKGTKVYLGGKLPSGKECEKHFSEIWDIHNFCDICEMLNI